MPARKIKRQLPKIASAVLNSRVDIIFPVKMRVVEIILNLMYARQKHFGLFVIVGWQRKWNEHLDISDSEQDIFGHHRTNLMNIKKREIKRYAISTTVNFDGAILINKNGEVLHSGVLIEGLRPKVVAHKIHPGTFKDLSEQFGFKNKVHTRHLSAITASYIFKNTTVFTVSEEDDSFHIFERGRILYSS